MSLSRQILFLSIFFVLCSCAQDNELADRETGDPLQYVDPFIGTGGHGHTFPGCSAPFGMMQLSPDTRLEGWDGCSGYHYSDSIIYGFSHTHLSGTGVADYCDVLLMPCSDQTRYSNDPANDYSYTSRFKKDSEGASPGYYKVFLDDHQVGVELTCLRRTGIHKYQYPTEKAFVMLDLVHRDQVLSSSVKQIEDDLIIGSRVSSSWAEEQHIYFAIQSSRKIRSMEIMESKSAEPEKLSESESVHIICGIEFEDDTSKELELQVAISAVSEGNAIANLRHDTEVAEKTFEDVKSEVEGLWRDQLSRISIQSNREGVLRNFYTAMYHSFLSPDLYSDVTGDFRGTDLEIHNSNEHDQYTVFSLWDTYRAAHPLYAILNQKESKDFIHSFLNQYKYGGSLPVWELAANYTGCMIGYHSVPVMYDAYQKGIIDEDRELALEAMLEISKRDELGKSEYMDYGYIPARFESESVSKTLEYAFDDWCISEFAKNMDRTEVASDYLKRAQSFKNVYDPQTKFMRARVNGGWFSPFFPEEVNFNYTEANAWQYNFYVPHDVYGLIELNGGKKEFSLLLDSLFTVSSETSGREQADISGLIGQYAHGNEPSHHMAYLYCYAEQPEKTQVLVRRILEELYTDQPDGLSGNEDCGQMSAWYVFSALGFYPVNPASNTYVIGSPLVDEALIDLESGQSLKIIVHNNSDENVYVKKMQWNKKEYDLPYITFDMIREGGLLEFEMSDKPGSFNYDRSIPEATLEDRSFVASPFVVNASRTFTGNMEIELDHIDDEVIIEYSLNDAPFEEYNSSIKIEDDAELNFVAKKDGRSSKAVRSIFKKMKSERSISLSEDYASQYSAGGNNALIDQLRGTNDFRTGDWQGYQGVDLTATVDLGYTQSISSVELGCLQDWNSWIFMPEGMVVYVSNDGRNYQSIGTVTNTVDEKEEGCIIQDLKVDVNRSARYVKVEVESKKQNPDWHRAPGDRCWIFLDEIVINSSK